MDDCEPKSPADVLAYLNEAVGDLNPTIEQAAEIFALMHPDPDDPTFALSRVCLAVTSWDRGQSFRRLFKLACAVVDGEGSAHVNLAAYVAERRELGAAPAAGEGKNDG